MKRIMIVVTCIFLLIGCQKGNTKVVKQEKKEDKQMKTMTVIIRNEDFQVDLYDNETVNNFIDKMPLTLKMDELHGNEKYNYLDFTLPTHAESVEYIKAGDVVLFGNNCLVVFYESFSTPYQYTRIGHISNSQEMKEVIGNGSITMTFEVRL